MRVRADLAALDAPRFERVMGAILGARGYAARFELGAETFKAVGDSHDAAGEDFEFGYLRDLWRMIEALFSGYIDRVLGDLDRLADEGRVSMPIDLDKGQDRLVHEVLAERASRVLSAIGIPPYSAAEVQTRVPWAIDLIEESYRLGLIHSELHPEVPWKVATDLTQKKPMTPADKEAVAHLRASAGSYLRPNVHNVPDDVMQRLLARDREIAMRRSIVGVRAKIHPLRLAGYMADLTGEKVDDGSGSGRKIWQGGTWDRDWRRVARTEMARAYSYGHLQAAMRAHPVNDETPATEPAKVPPRIVYKVTQRPRYDDQGRLLAPCTHCYRIWRLDDKTPRLYSLAQVIENGENATGDDGKPRRGKDLIATVGPTHPNDLCGPLLFYNPMMAKSYPGFAGQLKAFAGQGFEGVP